MAETVQRLALLTPHGVEAAHADAVAQALVGAGGAGDIAAVILRLATGDERSLINLVKRLAPAVQEAGAALVIACPGFSGDLASIAARGGADGVHADKAGESGLRDLRGRLRDGRILGAGGFLESKHEAMAAGEAGVDYVLFGGLYPDGAASDAERVEERAAWWVEIFETPCIAVATHLDHVAALAGIGAEFVGLESTLWLDSADGVATAQSRLRTVGEAQ